MSCKLRSDNRISPYAQANIETYKNEQRPESTINMVSSRTNGRTWSNITQMGPPGAPQACYSPSSGKLFLFGKSANMLDNGTRPEPANTCFQVATGCRVIQTPLSIFR